MEKNGQRRALKVVRHRQASGDEKQTHARSTKHREAYELHARGLRYREIAVKLGVPTGTVGAWISEARRELPWAGRGLPRMPAPLSRA